MNNVMKDQKNSGIFISVVVAVLVVGIAVFAKYQLNVAECETYQEVTGYETKMEGRHCYAKKNGQWDRIFNNKEGL